MSHKGQLQTMIRYVQMNPERLATKRLMPEYFRVQEGIEIAGRTYAGVGNAELLQRAKYMPVHVRQTMVDEAEHGDNKRLRDYYKPQDSLFDAEARKKVLILRPWEYDPQKKHVCRAECIAMNQMAEEICDALSASEAAIHDYVTA